MKEISQDQEKRKFVFYSDDAFINHVGSHYENIILQAEIDMKEVITIKNIYNCKSSIPLERALNLLEKYYRMNKQLNKRHIKKHNDDVSENNAYHQKENQSHEEALNISQPKNIHAKAALADSVLNA